MYTRLTALLALVLFLTPVAAAAQATSTHPATPPAYETNPSKLPPPPTKSPSTHLTAPKPPAATPVSSTTTGVPGTATTTAGATGHTGFPNVTYVLIALGVIVLAGLAALGLRHGSSQETP